MKTALILLSIFSYSLYLQSNDVVSVLKIKLEKDDFTFVEKKNDAKTQIKDCETNKVLIFEKHIETRYYSKSKKTDVFNPDFKVSILKFESEEIAANNFEKAKSFLKSDRRFCNGKGPYKLVLKSNSILYFQTRAEMFRAYIDKYGEYIENYR